MPNSTPTKGRPRRAGSSLLPAAGAQQGRNRPPGGTAARVDSTRRYAVAELDHGFGRSFVIEPADYVASRARSRPSCAASARSSAATASSSALLTCGAMRACRSAP